MTSSDKVRVRLAQAIPDTTAAMEGKCRALSHFVDRLVTGQATPLDEDQVRTDLEALLAVDPTTSRGVSAVLKAANDMDRLDAPRQGLVTPEAPDDTWDELDGFALLDRITDAGRSPSGS